VPRYSQAQPALSGLSVKTPPRLRRGPDLRPPPARIPAVGRGRGQARGGGDPQRRPARRRPAGWYAAQGGGEV